MALVNGTPGDDILNGTSGDDQIYGFDGTDQLYGGDGNDYLNPGNNSYYDWIDAGAGNDTIDFTDVSGSVPFYNIAHNGLSAGITVNVDGTTNTGTIDKGINGTTTITNVANALNANGIRFYGTSFDDVFNLNPGDNGSVQVQGFGGIDIFNIGVSTGTVILEFSGAPIGVNVNLATGIISNNGSGSTSSITGPGHVTNLRASSMNDKLRGSSQDERFDGNDGNDRIYGRGGTDQLYGGNGDDYLNPGNNSFYDWIDAGAGNDTIDFSSTTDSQSFYNIANYILTAGITVNVNGTTNTGTVDKGINGTTTITNVANALNAGGIRFYGTDFDDVFNLNPGDNGSIQARGLGGNDIFNIGASTGSVVLDLRYGTGGVNVNLATGSVIDDGYGGTDTITGPGNVTWLRASFFDDTVRGSANDERFSLYSGTDTLNARGGFDTLDYSYIPGSDVVDALNVDLGAGTATGTYNGVAFTHTIKNIERVLGSEFNDDVLRGANAQKDVLEGIGGNDTLIGRGGGDTLKGGAGNDTLKGGAGKDRLLGDDGKDKLEGGDGNDRLLGGKGSDKLNGGKGDDKMTGEGGKDTFVFSKGQDVVTDFDALNNREKIDLSGVAAITGIKNLKNTFLKDVDGNAVIDDGNGNTLTLNGVDIGDLNKGDFIF
jgi:Ca2+-binding RTX toxin-like protein